MVVTKHAKARLKHRCGFSGKNYDKIALRALQDGITHSEVKGRLGRWVDGLYLSKKNANNIRLYGDKAYLFHNNVLITVIQIPTHLIGELNYIREKTKKGNYKKNKSKSKV